MYGKITEENVVEAPASSVWGIYRGLELSHFVSQHLADVIGTVDFIEGDGGVGTVVRLKYPPGTPGIGFLKERFKVMDNEKRIKVTEQIEGGFLALGFNSLSMGFEIIENGTESTIIKSTIEYDIDEKLAENVSLVSTKPFEIIAEAVGKHLAAKKASA